MAFPLARRAAALFVILAGIAGGSAADPPASPLPPELAAWQDDWIVEWARPAPWSPFLFRGVLRLDHGESGWRAGVELEETSFGCETTRVDLRPDVLRLLCPAGSDGRWFLDLFRDGDVLHGTAMFEGERRVPRSIVEGGRRWRSLIAPGTHPWPAVTAEQAGMADRALADLLLEAQLTHSSGIAVIQDERLVMLAGERPSAPVPLTSVTKAIASLAVPLMIEEDAWPSIDAPVGTVIEDWSSPEDERRSITLRHVLSHSTGLETPYYPLWIEEAQQDLEEAVLAAPLEESPGVRFEYSNLGVEITPIVLRRVTGLSLTDYLTPRLFDPLGISARWFSDPEGHVGAHSGLSLSALDLARIGVLLANDGEHAGTRLLPRGWVAEATGGPATSASGVAGMGWFLAEGGGFYHQGDSGALLFVDPARGLVVARTHAGTRGDALKRRPQHGSGKLLPLIAAL